MISLTHKPDRVDYKWKAMFTVSTGTFMSTLDSSIVNVSLPSIMTSLHAKFVVVQWVVVAYLLVVTGLLLTFGRLGDLLGRKPVYILGFAIFTSGSLFCGLSRNIYLLIASRGFQAIGAAMIMANGAAIITEAFPDNERGRALGINGAVVATGLTVGPALGGFLVGTAGWPMIFFVNLPIGLFGIALAQKILGREKRHPTRQFDILGSMLLIMSLAALTTGLSRGPEVGWQSPLIKALMGAWLLFGVFFIVRERRTDNPVLDFELFRDRLFAAACASAFLNFASTFSVTFLMPFYLAGVLGYSPQRMGATLTTVPLTVALIAPFSGAVSDRIGSRVLGSLGLATSCLGLVLIGYLGESPDAFRVICSLAVVGLGTGIFQSPNNSAIMGCVPPNMLGVAAGMQATMRNLGMVSGVAVSAAVYSSRLASYRTSLPMVEASSVAFRDAMLVAAAICAIGVIASSMRGPSASPRE